MRMRPACCVHPLVPCRPLLSSKPACAARRRCAHEWRSVRKETTLPSAHSMEASSFSTAPPPPATTTRRLLRQQQLLLQRNPFPLVRNNGAVCLTSDRRNARSLMDSWRSLIACPEITCTPDLSLLRCIFELFYVFFSPLSCNAHTRFDLGCSENQPGYASAEHRPSVAA